jgi:hypothetical protein
MTSYKTDDFDKQKLDEAWSRLQAKLAKEPVQFNWAEWTQASLEQAIETQLQGATEMGMTSSDLKTASVTPSFEGVKPASTAGTRKQTWALSWLHKRRKWAGLAAACLVFVGAFIITPAGNEALASILNKFRMQDVTVVQEDDLQQLFSQISPDGKTREQINKFGTFTQTSGTMQGQFEPAEAAKALGYKLTVPADYKADKTHGLFVSPSNKLTFQIHVDEVNQAMKRLGAKKLLPTSIDRKPITLELGETVNYHLVNEQRKEWYSFMQQPVPVITVDPSIPLAEALDAVLEFPLLPANLKQGLQQSSILSGGNVPLPVIKQGNSEKVNVSGINVILTASKETDQIFYSATWVKDGHLYDFGGGNLYKDRALVLAKIKELIGS